VRADGEDLRWSDLIFREVIGRFFHRAFDFLVLLYIVVAFSNEKQGIHDMISNTRVVFVE
ncbi:RDD family protein, partial [Vitellibacter sp. q18]|nr:RDD family protein [Aequorivita lutea]